MELNTNPPSKTTLTEQALDRFRSLRMQDPNTMPPMLEFFAEWGHGLEAFCIVDGTEELDARDAALELISIGTPGFSCDRVVLCVDVFVTGSGATEKVNALLVTEADRNADGGVNIAQVLLPYDIRKEGIAWAKPYAPEYLVGKELIETFEEAFARPKALDVDVDGVFMLDLATELFGLDRDKSRTYMRAAVASLITTAFADGGIQLALASESEEERDAIAGFMERTTGIKGLNVN